MKNWIVLTEKQTVVAVLGLELKHCHKEACK